MKTAFILLLCFLSFSHGFSQKTDTVYYSADEVYSILTDSLPDKLGLGCDYFGTQTENIGYFLMFVEAEKYDYIKKLAYSDFASNQLLSVLALEALELHQKLTLDEKLQLRIQEIKNSEINLPSCCGCVPCEGGKLKYLLSKRGKKNYLVKTFRGYIENQIGKK